MAKSPRPLTYLFLYWHQEFLAHPINTRLHLRGDLGDSPLRHACVGGLCRLRNMWECGDKPFRLLGGALYLIARIC
jgi:hypothetical protein